MERNARNGDSEGTLPPIVAEEEKVLARVKRTLANRKRSEHAVEVDYEAQLISLRDQIHEARLEDVPPLIEEMERLQHVAARRAKVIEGVVDSGSPYFGRLVIDEDNTTNKRESKREVLIGKATYLDAKTGVRIVDWRDAPVSRIYYRYEEGDDFDENFGGRDVEGEVVTRRSLAISDGVLRRVGAPQGTFVLGDKGWRQLGESAAKLRGGQGAAARPEDHHQPGTLGTGQQSLGDEKFLPEIAALIDPRQFELITSPASGLVVIQGGAGSGKTTIGLHRMAYLAFQDRQRYANKNMLAIVFNDALARYISRVLPALGVPGVMVITYERWVHRLREAHTEGLPNQYSEETPVAATKLKKHPAMLQILADQVAALGTHFESALAAAAGKSEATQSLIRTVWKETGKKAAPGLRVHRFGQWLRDRKGSASRLDIQERHALERTVAKLSDEARDVVTIWAETLTDRSLIEKGLARYGGHPLSQEDVAEAFRWCERQCPRVLAYRDERLAGETEAAEADAERRHALDGVDEQDKVELDTEDNTLLLRLIQLVRGGLSRKGQPLFYEHVFVDEAQDLSPVEMSVVFGATTKQRSITLAGDVAQRLHMHNGFSDWRGVLKDLGMDHVSIEPLKLQYRSTKEIIEFANAVLGPLHDGDENQAQRHGVPVELFRFAHHGDAVGFLGESLRELVMNEPKASIAVIARYPEQADMYYDGLRTSEVPHLRRIADQDFSFRPGVDVTDVRQVKGLEFDYVILVEVSRGSYPEDDESRHLLHIAATRAAHQLWVTTSSEPSLLVPEELRAQGF